MNGQFRVYYRDLLGVALIVGCGGGGGGEESDAPHPGCNAPDCGSAPDVSVVCSASESGPSSCQCAAGKNEGKTFALGDCGELSFGEVWNRCNL